MGNIKYSKYQLHYARMGNKRPSLQVTDYVISKAYDLMKTFLPPDKEIKILDCGCGVGLQLYILNELGYKNLTGIELLEQQAEVAREEMEGKADIFTSDAFDWLPEHENEFDFVLCYDVLEHIPATKAIEFTTLIHKSLKKDGIAVFRVPNMSSILASHNMYMDITHVAGYTEYSLKQLLDVAGFVNHGVASRNIFTGLKRWRPWAPWRGVREVVNWALHVILFGIKGVGKWPSAFEGNIVMYSHK